MFCNENLQGKSIKNLVSFKLCSFQYKIQIVISDGGVGALVNIYYKIFLFESEEQKENLFCILNSFTERGLNESKPFLSFRFF